MDYRPEILSYLATPITWAIAEVFALGLFFYCLINIIKKEEVNNLKILHMLELFGFIVYAGIFENLGVLSNTYNYSLDRFIMVGTVPLSLLMFEAVIFYAALRFVEVMKFPKLVIPIIVGILGMLQDLTIDPVAVFDLHSINGIMEGRWNWTNNYEGKFFGIPFFNYTGWFFLMFYYTSLIYLGRKIYTKFGSKFNIGIAYISISPIIGVLLILSPITRFFLFLSPIFPVYLNRTAEIVMLCLVVIISVLILFKYRKRSVLIEWKKEKVIWIIPLFLHLFDIILAFSLKITIAYIPVLLFAGIHLGYLAYYYLKSYLQLKQQSNIE